MKGYTIQFNIYADNQDEADLGKKALVDFIELMRQNGVAVRGSKLNTALTHLMANPFIKNQIVNYLK